MQQRIRRRVRDLTAASGLAPTDVLAIDGSTREQAFSWPISDIAAAGKVLWVDGTLGDDATGTRGSPSFPFATCAAAQTAASSGDCIVVLPGSYTLTAALGKNGVNWHLMPGVTITRTDDGIGGTFDDGGSAMTFSVTGFGDIARTVSEDAPESVYVTVAARHASSSISIVARDLSIAANADIGAYYVVAGYAGVLTYHARSIVATGDYYISVTAAWWANGSMYGVVEFISGVGLGAYSQVNATPTGDFYIRCHSIASASGAVYTDGSNTTAAMWVDVLTAYGSASIYHLGGTRLYVRAQKLFGSIVVNSNGGLLYVESDKVSAVRNGQSSFANLVNVGCASADARIAVKHWDRSTFTGETIKVSAGSVQLLGGDFVAGTAPGVEITGGTVRLQGMRIDTSGSASQKPVTVSGGSVILDRCTLIPHASADSVYAATAQTITNYGSVAKTAKNSNVTVNVQALLVDSNVV